MSAVSPLRCEGGRAVPAAVVSLLLGSTVAFLVLARLPWQELPAEPDPARAAAIAQAGIDQACGILLRRASERGWDAILAAGGVLPELGAETDLDTLPGLPAADGRLSYRVRIRDNDDDGDPTHDRDGLVWITSVGIFAPRNSAGLERGCVVRVAETALRVSRADSHSAVVVLAGR